MKKLQNTDLLSSFDSSFDTLMTLESIIKITQANCRDKEIYSVHYDLPTKDKKMLSEERNHYINMLNLALDKVSNLIEINLIIEKELSKL